MRDCIVEERRRRVIPDEFAGLARLAARTHFEPRTIEILPGDVGRRRYVRLFLGDNRTVLGVVYPAEEEDSRRRWLAARNFLRSEVRVPSVLADDGRGSQIVEDFGRIDLAGVLAEEPAARPRWLQRAAAAAASVSRMPDPEINAPFDAALFRRELELAREAVFDMHLAAPLTPAERSAHDAWADVLARELEDHPRRLCHRDFHVNNLFPIEEEVGVIDFQDLRSGPDTYDLASLLWERTTLSWMSPGLAEETLSDFTGRQGLEPAPFRARLDRVLLQRAWKVCGTFARAVALGRGEGYRRFLPAELALVRRLLQSPEDAVFRRVFEARLC
jgi:hypothetical protein